MNKDVSDSFETHFGALKDPRIQRLKLYPLTEVLFVVLCGTICGAESWRDFVIFGKEKLDGGQHMDAIEYDQRRTEYLFKHRYNVLRVWNNEVFSNIEGVLTTILISLEDRAT